MKKRQHKTQSEIERALRFVKAYENMAVEQKRMIVRGIEALERGEWKASELPQRMAEIGWPGK
jgi:hypothetical protein